MVNAKAIVLLLAVFVVVMAIAGIAVAQYVSAQTNAAQRVGGQLSQGGYNGYYQIPQQGCYPHGGAQYRGQYGYGYGRGMGMGGRFW
ncbi:MAG: hypothetical protein NWE98_07185 [Candidatus Bathyarchaeota archaeon]|nr:hypothetical protein [Candidatus Bathyarchaeota archaeon]